jgi:two-component system cell cycle response regulator DivK
MAVTAYSARGDEERIRAAGAQAYVSKPISVMKFAQTVDELLADERDRTQGDPATEAEIDNSESQANTSDDGPGPGETGGEEA